MPIESNVCMTLDLHGIYLYNIALVSNGNDSNAMKMSYDRAYDGNKEVHIEMPYPE